MTTPLRTSLSSPLRISEIPVGRGDGWLGLTLCPGKKDRGHGWDRDLATDVGVVREWGATTVVTLIEEHEFHLLAIEALAEEVRRFDMEWLHLPIRDVDIPDGRFEQAWKESGPAIHERLDAGQRILIHCRGGLGRTGLVAALILVERGIEARSAIRCVRVVRPHAIETTAQERYVLGWPPGVRLPSETPPIAALAV